MKVALNVLDERLEQLGIRLTLDASSRARNMH